MHPDGHSTPFRFVHNVEASYSLLCISCSTQANAHRSASSRAPCCNRIKVGVFNCEKCVVATTMHASCEFVRSIGKNSRTLVIQKHTTVSMKLLPMTRKPAPATEGMLRG